MIQRQGTFTIKSGAPMPKRLTRREEAPQRNMGIYVEGMDATIPVKWEQIRPWIPPPPKNFPFRIVDEGCGTGKLLALLGEQFPNAQIVGRDASPFFVRKSVEATKNLKNVVVLESDITKQRFSDQSVTVKIFSSVCHELASFPTYDPSRPIRTLRVSFRELQPKGRIIVRDGFKPDPEMVFLWLDNSRYARRPDRSLLTTRERFFAFRRDFLPVRRISYGRLVGATDDDWRLFLKSEDAQEFLMKKDYIANWNCEIREVSAIWTVGEWEAQLRAAGFVPLVIEPYISPWIVAHRLEGRARLYRWLENGKIVPLPFFPTNLLVVAERPEK